MDAPPITSAETDSEHLKLLSIFHYVVAGLAALFACIPIFHLVLGLVMLLAPDKLGPGTPPPAFIGMLFVVFATVFILAGWAFAILVLISGRFLAARKHYLFCLVMACVECIFMPFGTVLGVFTILTLVRPSVKELFAHKPPNPV
jgi:hypothetical protein